MPQNNSPNKSPTYSPELFPRARIHSTSHVFCLKTNPQTIPQIHFPELGSIAPPRAFTPNHIPKHISNTFPHISPALYSRTFLQKYSPNFPAPSIEQECTVQLHREAMSSFTVELCPAAQGSSVQLHREALSSCTGELCPTAQGSSVQLHREALSSCTGKLCPVAQGSPVQLHSGALCNCTGKLWQPELCTGKPCAAEFCTGELCPAAQGTTVQLHRGAALPRSKEEARRRPGGGQKEAKRRPG